MREIDLQTERKTQLVNITQEVRDALGGNGGASAALVYVPHTTAGVTINERIDPELVEDFEEAFQRIVGDDWGWQHVEAGEENAPSHVRTSLLGQQVVIPIVDGRLALGTWQGIFLCELDGPRRRKLYLTVLR